MMAFLHFNKTIAISIGIIGVSVPLFLYLKKRLWEDNEYEDILNIEEAMFFSDEGWTCRDHFKNENKGLNSNEPITCSSSNCPFKNLCRILHYLKGAKESLDVCIYLVTLKDISNQIVKAHKQGLKVRVITDEDMANGSGSQINLFRQAGIEVRHRHNSVSLMHHKFAVIDKCILMTGSLNWTMQAICGNWDNFLITTRPPIVKSFLKEFDRVWKVLE